MTQCPFCGGRTTPQDRNCPCCGGSLPAIEVSPSSPVSTSTAIEERELVDLACHNKIEAIKRYRERHRVGLAEAKQAVERLMEQHGIVAGPARPVGCTTMILLAVTTFWWCFG